MIEQIFLMLVFVHVFTSTLCNYRLIRDNRSIQADNESLLANLLYMGDYLDGLTLESEKDIVTPFDTVQAVIKMVEPE